MTEATRGGKKTTHKHLEAQLYFRDGEESKQLLAAAMTATPDAALWFSDFKAARRTLCCLLEEKAKKNDTFQGFGLVKLLN